MKTTNGRTLLAGVVVLLLLALSLHLSITASGGLPFQSKRFVSATFTDAGDLRVGDEVRQASLRVGQVRDISYGDDGAEVEMQLDPDTKVYSDAKAVIQARSALGQYFVELNPGQESSGDLGEDATIPVDRTQSPVTLDQVLTVFDPKTRKAAGTLLRETGGGIGGHSQDLSDAVTAAPDLVTDLGTVAGAAGDDSADLAGVIQEARDVSRQFGGRTHEVRELVTSLGTTLESVGVEDGRHIEETLVRAPAALRQARVGLAAVRRPLRDLERGARALQPGARALGNATPDMRGLLREAPGPFSKVDSVAEQAVPAVRSLDGLVEDASPLANRLEKTFAAAAPTAAVLAPYAPEIVRFFSRWADANRPSDKAGHYLRITVLLKPESILGTTQLADPLMNRNPYPAPGQAERDKANYSILGGR